MRFRNVCFTLNNYDKVDEDYIKQSYEFTPSVVKYVIYGKEVGESGTPHLQGYIEFKRQLSLSGVKGVIGNKCHIENRHGNQKQAIDYCKKDGDWVEYGEPKGNGRIKKIVRKLTSSCPLFQEVNKWGFEIFMQTRKIASDKEIFEKYYTWISNDCIRHRCSDCETCFAFTQVTQVGTGSGGNTKVTPEPEMAED